LIVLVAAAFVVKINLGPTFEDQLKFTEVALGECKKELKSEVITVAVRECAEYKVSIKMRDY
jgi:hypothetical protein